MEIRVPRAPPGAIDWPVFPAPLARIDREGYIRRHRVADKHGEARSVHDVVGLALEPMLPPFDGEIAPFDGGPWDGIVGKGVIPWPDDRLDRRMHAVEHTRDGIAIAVQ